MYSVNPFRWENGSAPSSIPSGKSIDVLIPAIEKDLATLPHVIDSIRKHVRHPIGRIHLVSPDSRPLKSLAKAKGCAFVDERSLVSLKKSDIRYGTKQWERSGWLYQQLLKLSGDTVGKEAYVLVADADTVLIRPHRFLKGRRPIFYTRTWSQPEYYRTYRKLLGREPTSPVSFVTHYMLFHKRTLAGLKKAIEKKHGTKWYEAILKCMDLKQPFAFSEFETYGNYVYSAAPGSCLLRSAKNKHVHRAFGTLTGAELRTYSRKYRSLSFHQRREYSKRG